MMNDRLRESLSALMDGEIDELELARLLKEAEADPQVLEAWSRYHLVSALMKRESVMPMSERLAARLRQSLDEEPAPGASQDASSPQAHWMKPAVSVAVAAAVAFAVVLGYQMLDSPEPNASPAVVVAPAADIGNDTVNAALTERRRLDAYMLHHAQHRALNERPGVIPIAKVASFDAQ